MNIEIFSDLVCPWCYIGKRRLDEVLNSPTGTGVQVIWRAYQLYPGVPDNGMAMRDFARQRYGDSDRSASRSQLQTEAGALGLRMDFERIPRMPNTFNGHRLLHRARQFGVQHQLADTLFESHFERGEDVGATEVLAVAAARHGMDHNETVAYLQGTDGADAVRREIERASNVGVGGVPCYLLGGAFMIPGAQEVVVISQIIERAKLKLAEPA